MIKVVRKAREFFYFNRRYRTRRDLHHLLEQLRTIRDFEERIDWVVYFFAWLRLPPSEEIGTHIERERIPSVRFKYLFSLLDKNPELKNRFFVILGRTLLEMSSVDLLSEVGLSNQVGFLQEFGERLTHKLLPKTPLRHDLATLLKTIFEDEEDLLWISAFDVDVLKRIVTEMAQISPALLFVLLEDACESLVFLSAQTSALVFSSQFRERMNQRHLRSLPVYDLPMKIHEFVRLRRNMDFVSLNSLKDPLLNQISLCFLAIDRVQAHLDSFGVSISLVFQMERLRRQLNRMTVLIQILGTAEPDFQVLRQLITQLVSDSQSRFGLRAFIKDSFGLMTQKVVERNSEIGEHYIVKSKAQFTNLFRKAGGGGLITAFTVFIKIYIYKMGLPYFMAGVANSLNYSISFLVIQLNGFTLATKQPSATAPRIAGQLKDLNLKKLNEVTDEMLALIRSQFVGILGNVVVVAPVALSLFYFSQGLFGASPISHEKAEAYLNSTNLLGPSFIYATFTGGLLFASSIFAGWFDNWFTYRKLRQRIRYNDKFRAVFGRVVTRTAANYLQKNAAALAANVSLGCLLGFTPEFMKFMGLPLDIRHVTLATGTLAAALPVLGYKIMLTWDFWNATLGIIVIGFLNVLVSFSLAFSLALRSQKVRPEEKRALLLSLIRTIAKDPLILFKPK